MSQEIKHRNIKAFQSALNTDREFGRFLVCIDGELKVDGDDLSEVFKGITGYWMDEPYKKCETWVFDTTAEFEIIKLTRNGL